MTVVTVEGTSQTPNLAPGQEAPKADAVKDGQAVAADPNAAAPERPEWLPEKFSSPEDMAAAYAELEKKQSNPDATEEKPEADAEGASEDGQDQAAENATGFSLPGVEQADFDAMSARYETNGVVAPEDYAKLSEAGYSKDVVDAYLNGVKATAEASEVAQGKAIETVFSSQENFDEVADWAGTHLSDAELTRYNNLANNPETLEVALEWVKGKYEAVNGKAPNLTKGNRQGDSNVTPFASHAEAQAAMRDPRYRTDPAYQAEYIARRRVSPF